MQIVGFIILLVIALFLVKLAIGIAMVTLKLVFYVGIAAALGYGGWYVYRQTLDSSAHPWRELDDPPARDDDSVS